jgi:hypothetical protein
MGAESTKTTAINIAIRIIVRFIRSSPSFLARGG